MITKKGYFLIGVKFQINPVQLHNFRGNFLLTLHNER